MAHSSVFGLVLLLPLLLFSNVRGQDCPCVWYEDTRVWDCANDLLEEVPTSCWELNTDVKRVILDSHIPSVGKDDFAHDNLEGMTRLELRQVDLMDSRALRKLTKLVILDVRNGQLAELPDVSKMNDIVALYASGNQFTKAPKMTHMTSLIFLELQNNKIETLADKFLPTSAHKMTVNLERNSMAIVNASSIITATDASTITFDDLRAIRATHEEYATLKAKNFNTNVDIDSIIEIIEDPTDP